MTMTSMRLLVCLAASLGLLIGHLDVATAYLNALLDRTIYMRAPEGMKSAHAGQFLRLKKALYGLHQSGRLWSELLLATLKCVGFRSCVNGDPYVLVRRSRTQRFLIIGVYVDDMPTLYHSSDAAEMAEAVGALQQYFDITVVPQIHTLLGMRIQRDSSTGVYTMHQAAYTQKVLEQFGYMDAKPSLAPESTQRSNSSYEADKQLPGPSSRPQLTVANFRAAVGALQWLACGTRFDIAHAVNNLARAVAAPDENACSRARKLFRYLAGTRTLGLTYFPTTDGQPVSLEAYSDSDYAGDESSSKSTTGVLLKIGGAPIHWFSRQQPTVSRSSTEAEYIAAGECGRVIVWLRVLLAELGCAQAAPTTLHIDNETALDMTRDDGRQFPKRKHIRVLYHWIREAVQDGFISPRWIPTAQQQADLLTKPLSVASFMRLRALILGTTAQQKADASLSDR